MSTHRIMVVDGNWVWHRAYYTLKTSRPIEVALPERFVGLVCKDALATRCDRLLIAFDGADVFRHKLAASYKANRQDKGSKEVKTLSEKAMDDARSKKRVPVQSAADRDAESGTDMYEYLPHAFALFEKLGLAFFQPPKHEADDVLCSMAATYAPEQLVIGMTKDKDAYQWITERAWTYDSTGKAKDGTPKPITIKPDDVLRLKGVSPSQMIDYQVMMGDGIDGVAGLEGYGPKKAKAILNEYGSIRNWYKKADAKTQAWLRTQLDHLKLTRQLIELCTDVLPPMELDDMKVLRQNPKIVKHMPQSYHDYVAFVNPKSRGLFRRK